MEYDPTRQRVYVSLPSLNQVAVVNALTWQIESSYTVAPSPHGVALSIDGTRLFVAKRTAGAVAVIDLATGLQNEILLGALLGDPRTYDVVEATPERLYVSANPGSNGFAWIVQVALDQGNLAQRVASNNIIRCDPTFEVSPDRTALYVGECFSPASLYKLDITLPNAPLIVQDQHGSIGGTDHVETHPAGTRVYLRSGQILDASTLLVVGQVGAGWSRFDVDPTRLFVAVTPGAVQTWNVNTQVQVGNLPLPCTFNAIRELLVLPGETGFLVLGDNKLCGVAELPPCAGDVQAYCPPAPNSAGPGADLAAVGNPQIATNDFGLALSGAPGGTLAVFFFGATPAHLPFGDGWLCISPAAPGILRLPGIHLTDPGGSATLALDFNAPPLSAGPITSFSTWYFQAWYRDPAGIPGTGMNTSGALRVDFCP